MDESVEGCTKATLKATGLGGGGLAGKGDALLPLLCEADTETSSDAIVVNAGRGHSYDGRAPQLVMTPAAAFSLVHWPVFYACRAAHRAWRLLE